MSRRQEVQLQKDDVTISVMPSSVPRYQKNGWTKVEDGSSDEGVVLTEPQPSPANYWSQSADPSKDKE